MTRMGRASNRHGQRVSAAWRRRRDLGVLGIARDMTDTKKLEQQIRNSRSSPRSGKLAAGVAHEINNPLAGILNCLYNLRKGTLSPARQEEYWVSMEDGVRRVQKIVRQLLDFSQQHEPEFSSTDINQIVDRVLVLTNPSVRTQPGPAGDAAGTLLCPLMVDRHMIEQVLMNLILNAVQAMKGGGVLTIRTTVAEGVCRVEVSDTGSGIPPSVLPRISIRSSPRRAKAKGTGLGLSVSLGIAERHGGKILVESEVGKGTTFTLCLRCRESGHWWKGCHEGVGHPVGRRRALIRLSMVDALEAVGYDVHAVASGTEGLDVLRQKTVRPGHYRPAAPRRGWAHDPQSHQGQSPETEVVMITAHGSVESAVGAMKLGAFRLHYEAVSDGRAAVDRRARWARHSAAARKSGSERNVGEQVLLQRHPGHQQPDARGAGQD